MNKPRLLDLFSGAGGAARGWLLRARQPRRKRALPVSAAAVRVGIAAAHE